MREFFRNKSSHKKNIFLIFFVMMNIFVYPENSSIEYYGVFSPDADKNMIKMTDDLFFAQLSEMNIQLNDKRMLPGSTALTSSEIDFSGAQEKAMSFYVEIKRKGDALSKWNCTIFLKNNSTQNIASYNREYDSYYKILMDSKASLKGIFQELLQSSEAGSVAASPQQSKAITENSSTGKSFQENEKDNKNAELTRNQPGQALTMSSNITENISGTWLGEEHIDKIVILKGGRGFIILKNGSSMNVSINQAKKEDGEIIFLVKQVSHANASYFPEIPRAKALEEAVKAAPIEYKLVLTNENTLQGTKTTLIENKAGSEIIQGNIDVAWKKLN